MHHKTEDLELTVRSKNTALQLGLDTVAKLADKEPNTLATARGVGTTTLQEWARVLIANHEYGAIPRWLKGVARQFEYDPGDAELLSAGGWREMSGPYEPGELWMLEAAIGTLQRGGIKWTVGRLKSGHLALFRQGGVEVEAEEAT